MIIIVIYLFYFWKHMLDITLMVFQIIKCFFLVEIYVSKYNLVSAFS